MAGAAVAFLLFLVGSWVTHLYRGWPKTHPFEASEPPPPVERTPAPADSTNKVFPPTVHQEPARIERADLLPETELLMQFTERSGNVVAVVRNPQAEPKSGFALWIEDVQKYSPEAGFHPVAEFASVSKPCKMVLSAGTSPLFHDQKQIYVLMLSSNEKRTSILYGLRGTRHQISVGSGTWRIRVRVEYEKRSRTHVVFVRWDGPRTAPVLTTDPTAAPT